MRSKHSTALLRVVAATSILGATTFVATGASPAPSSAAPAAAPTTCQLGNGVQHVIHITFDNVHFFRDNPNVPSDLEQMPTLLHFLEDNGTLNSNNHTPLIAHTGDDS